MQVSFKNSLGYDVIAGSQINLVEFFKIWNEWLKDGAQIVLPRDGSPVIVGHPNFNQHLSVVYDKENRRFEVVQA